MLAVSIDGLYWLNTDSFEYQLGLNRENILSSSSDLYLNLELGFSQMGHGIMELN